MPPAEDRKPPPRLKDVVKSTAEEQESGGAPDEPLQPSKLSTVLSEKSAGSLSRAFRSIVLDAELKHINIG